MTTEAKTKIEHAPPLAKLFEGDLLGYLAQFSTENSAKNNLWFYVHVPKCAGSSFREEIADVLQPDINVEIDYKALAVDTPERTYTELVSKAILDFSEIASNKPIRFASGHLTYQSIAPALRSRPVHYTTMIRHPIMRIISDYNYRTSSEHPAASKEKKKYPSIRDFIEDTDNQNVIDLYLTGPAEYTIQEKIDKIINNYAFIGLFEEYALSLKIQMAALSCRAKASYFLRNSADKGHSGEQASKEDLLVAEKMNSTDMELYTHVSELYQKVAKNLHSWFDFDKVFKAQAGLPF